MLIAGIAVAVVLLLLVPGIPVGIALFITGFLGLWYTLGGSIAANTISLLPYAAAAQEGLTVLPLFILAGCLLDASDVAGDAYDAANKWLGRLPGGLGITTIGASAAFAATTGSSAATAATVGRIAVPQMQKYGYSNAMATGIASAGGILGIMIPPSIPLVIYGIVTETSIGRLLVGGLIPGLLTAGVYALGLSLVALLRPTIAPKGESCSWKIRVSSLSKVWGIAVLFIVVIGGIFTGIFTPSEAAAAGVAIAFIILVIRKGLKSWRPLMIGLRGAASTSCMILFIIMGATMFGAFFALSGVSTSLATGIAGSGLPKYGILFLIIFMYIPLGSFLEPLSMALITLPLFFPIIMELGFNPIWFGIMIVSVWELALLTPPVGLNVYIMGGLFPEIPLEQIFKGVSLFIFLHLIVLVVLVSFPDLATWLPGLM